MNNGKIGTNYQISLDKLTDLALTNEDTIRSVALSYSTILQELIDNYEKSLRLCVIETKEKIIAENALDMACEELANRGRNCVSCNFEDCSNVELNPICEDKKFWKEYLLKEVQDGK